MMMRMLPCLPPASFQIAAERRKAADLEEAAADLLDKHAALERALQEEQVLSTCVRGCCPGIARARRCARAEPRLRCVEPDSARPVCAAASLAVARTEMCRPKPRRAGRVDSSYTKHQ